MSDKYQDIAHNPIGKLLVKNLGLPNPPYLDRFTGGALVKGTVLTGSADNGAISKAVTAALKNSKIEATGVAAPTKKYKGIVFDASGISSAADLVKLSEFFTPIMRNIAPSGRVVVIGRLVEDAKDENHTIAQRALEGFTRSVGKEIGGGGTANLVYVAKGAEKALESTLGFFLSAKSAYVSGQVIRVGTTGITAAPKVADVAKPLAGKVALVTGASRGLGLADMETLARDGATVIGLDVPPLEEDLKKNAERLGGGYIVGDITSPDAGKEIGDYIKKNHGKVDIIVHNAGITRDKRLRNMKPENWNLVVDISVGAPQRITDYLIDNNLVNDGGRIVGIASIAGIAGNNGQTNYASAKAGVIGWIQSLAARVADKGITANVIAPGFMETEMVKTIPLGIREAGRRMNSMSQGGLPVDVAEAIAWLASPGSQAVSGNVVGVNGQMILGRVVTTTRSFGKAPASVPLLLKAALPALPGIGGLPGIKHSDAGAPDLVLELKGVRTDKAHLAKYNAICGYAPADILPPLYPHFAAFGLHLSLLTDTSFPFAPMGVVHLRNKLVHHRPIGLDEVFDLTVKAHDLRPHPKGRLIDVTTTATIDGDEVWSETMTIFNRGRKGAGEEATPPPLEGVEAPAGAMQWVLKGDLGRRFAGVSGDRNPIHLYPLTAKAFGFPTNIAHGMWTKSRALAALQNRLPDSYQVDVEFQKPVLLPSTVAFGFTPGTKLPITFGLASTRKAANHLIGRVSAL